MSHYTGQVPATRRAPDWRDAALCRTEDPELFFPKGETGPSLLDIEQAKAICRSCPVVDTCLNFALTEGIPSGIFGGLTETERYSLRRSVSRGRTTAEGVPAKVSKARRPRRDRTLQTLFSDNTKQARGGHLVWTGGEKTGVQSRAYTPKQIAFIVGRGRRPEGPVIADCGNSECVLPAHLTDQRERGYCGTRPGYQRHLKEGTEVCGPCRKANTDADNRLRRTGTSKVSA